MDRRSNRTHRHREGRWGRHRGARKAVALAAGVGLLPGWTAAPRSAVPAPAPGDLAHRGSAAGWCDPAGAVPKVAGGKHAAAPGHGGEESPLQQAARNQGEREVHHSTACRPRRIASDVTYRRADASAGAEPVGFAGASSGTTGPEPSATLHLPAPADAAPGDVLLAVIGSGYGHVESPPPGWVEVRQDLKMRPRDDLAIQSYVKVTSGREPAGWDWPLVATWGAATKGLAAGSVMAFRGVDLARPVFSSGVRAQTPDRRKIECPSVDAPPGGMLVCAYVTDDPNRIAVPEVMRLVAHLTTRGDDTYAVAYERRDAPGPTGLRIARLNGVKGGSDDFAHAVILAPAGPGTRPYAAPAG